MLLLKTILLCIIITLLLLQFNNYSNIKNIYIVPIISSLLVKYLLGDWDEGYQWSIYDIYYWMILIIVSGLITIMYKH
jgi:hypothetical protein